MAKQLKAEDKTSESDRRVYSAPALEKGLDILETCLDIRVARHQIADEGCAALSRARSKRRGYAVSGHG